MTFYIYSTMCMIYTLQKIYHLHVLILCQDMTSGEEHRFPYGGLMGIAQKIVGLLRSKKIGGCIT